MPDLVPVVQGCGSSSGSCAARPECGESAAGGACLAPMTPHPLVVCVRGGSEDETRMNAAPAGFPGLMLSVGCVLVLNPQHARRKRRRVKHSAEFAFCRHVLPYVHPVGGHVSVTQGGRALVRLFPPSAGRHDASSIELTAGGQVPGWNSMANGFLASTRSIDLSPARGLPT